MHQFEIRYNDTAFNNENGFVQQKENGITFDQLLRHIVLATQIYVGDKVEISVEYIHLRRKEGNIGNQNNGLNGFSLGVGVLLKRIQLGYARSYYQRQTAWNQFGLNLRMID